MTTFLIMPNLDTIYCKGIQHTYPPFATLVIINFDILQYKCSCMLFYFLYTYGSLNIWWYSMSMWAWSCCMRLVKTYREECYACRVSVIFWLDRSFSTGIPVWLGVEWSDYSLILMVMEAMTVGEEPYWIWQGSGWIKNWQQF